MKVALLLVAVLAACNAFPLEEPEQDMSIFFEHVDLNARIVGGSQAGNGAHPHMVAITNGANVRNLVCGGSIISRRTVLTAAHCIVPIRSGNNVNPNARATVGTNRWASGGQMYSYQRFVIHPNYNANTIKNDIGVLHTSSNIVWNNAVRAIAVNYDFIGDRMNSRVAGWGRIRAGGAISANLLQLNVQTIDGNRCVRDVASVAASLNIRVPAVNPNVELCTFHSRNHGTCNGDSGSALLRVDRGQQIGIVSWGIPCALGAPDMFVRISAFRNWVQSNTVN
ncbi:chymotrypsin-1-like [Manduca sexta]|uniref:chymotrypsin-1 n=1 Tax=Manduca sexta TaxID=7130 RepID=UPI00188EAD1D|nr:chymotrypsin-1 [Manduca sexta]XP_037301075.1 chymotrypsin-1-like [Manduca sexta]